MIPYEITSFAFSNDNCVAYTALSFYDIYRVRELQPSARCNQWVMPTRPLVYTTGMYAYLHVCLFT